MPSALMGAGLAAAIGIGSAAWQSANNARATSNVPQPHILSATIKAADVVGTRPVYLMGKQSNPYTLVEFFDYQCPPCKMTYAKLPVILGKYSDKLKLTVRHFPLKMHIHAMPAAIASEAAREQGAFPTFHDALMQDEVLSDATILETVRRNHLDEKKFHEASLHSAPARVQEDIAEGKNLKLVGTPSFILCCPDGKVVNLASVQNVDKFIH